MPVQTGSEAGIARCAVDAAVFAPDVCNWPYINHLRFLSQFGTRLAFQNGVETEMNANGAAPSNEPQGIWLSDQSVRQMRSQLHELANTLTGVMIAGGLLTQFLEGGSLAGYAADVCEASERGSLLVCELRGHLLAACGEAVQRIKAVVSTSHPNVSG